AAAGPDTGTIAPILNAFCAWTGDEASRCAVSATSTATRNRFTVVSPCFVSSFFGSRWPRSSRAPLVPELSRPYCRYSGGGRQGRGRAPSHRIASRLSRRRAPSLWLLDVARRAQREFLQHQRRDEPQGHQRKAAQESGVQG